MRGERGGLVITYSTHGGLSEERKLLSWVEASGKSKLALRK